MAELFLKNHSNYKNWLRSEPRNLNDMKNLKQYILLVEI